jgi:hypothetical protein
MSERSLSPQRGGPVETMSRLWQGLLVLVIVAALITQLVLLIGGGADANSGSSGTAVAVGTRLIRLFSYFTIESNLIVLAVAVTLAVRPGSDGPVWRVVHLDALLGIVITGLVYDIVLARQVHLTGAALWAGIGFHYVSPWAMLLGWIAFGPRPRISWRTVGGAFIWPVLWIVYTFAHGAASKWYPYSFMDASKLGLGTALINTCGVVVVAAVLAVAFRFLDRIPDLRSWRPARPAVVPTTDGA